METSEVTSEIKSIAHEAGTIITEASKNNSNNLSPSALPEQLLVPPSYEILPESRWVFFRRNRYAGSFSEPTKEKVVKIGNQVFLASLSDYIGSVSGFWKLCFPGSYSVEEELRRLECINPQGPWYLPVFLTEGEKVFRANLIDDEKLMRFYGKYIEADRVMAIENEVKSLRKIVWQIHDAQKPKRILIFVDYQNFYKSVQENGVQTNLETVVDLVCTFGAPIRRQENFRDESLVYIFDFFNHAFIDLYTSWKNKGYNFVQVQSKSRSFNPTDDVIIERARKELHRLKNHIDVFCIISGDRIFHHITTEARILGKKTIVAAFSSAMSRDLYVATNLYCDLDFWLIREPHEARPSTLDLVAGESA